MRASGVNQRRVFATLMAGILVLIISSCSSTNIELEEANSLPPQGELAAEVGPDRVPLSHSLSTYHWAFEPGVSADGTTAVFFDVSEEEVPRGRDRTLQYVATALTVVDLDDHTRSTVIELPGFGLAASFSTQGMLAFIQGTNPAWHYVVNLRDQTLLGRITIPLTDTKIAPNGLYAIGRERSTGANPGARSWPAVYSIVEQRIVASFPEMGGFNDFAFSPDGSRFVIAGTNSKEDGSGILIGELAQIDQPLWVRLSAKEQTMVELGVVTGDAIIVRVGNDYEYFLVNTAVSLDSPVSSQKGSSSMGAPEKTIGDFFYSDWMTMSPDGSLVFNGSSFLDTTTGRIVDPDIPLAGLLHVGGTATSPDTYVVNTQQSQAFAFDWKTLQPTREFVIQAPAGGTVQAITDQGIVFMAISGAYEGPAEVVITTVPFEEASPRSQRPPTKALAIPPGYEDVGGGVAGRFISKECSSTDRGCWWVEIYAYQDCLQGGFLEIRIFDGEGQMVGVSNEFFFPLPAGQTGVVELENTAETGVVAEFYNGYCL